MNLHKHVKYTHQNIIKCHKYFNALFSAK